jgi:putative SOS response-associated peptidase YedK
MIITEPNDFIADVHDRMPVLLSKGTSSRGFTETPVLN